MRKFFVSLIFFSAIYAEGINADHFKNLKFRFIGPDSHQDQ